MAQVNAERAAAARGEPPPTPPQQPQEPQPPLGSAPTPTPPPLPTPTPTPSSADVDVLRQMRQTACEQIGQDQRAMSVSRRRRWRNRCNCNGSSSRWRKRPPPRGGSPRRTLWRGSAGPRGARGVTKKKASAKKKLRGYIILPRGWSSSLMRPKAAGCLVLAPRSRRPLRRGVASAYTPSPIRRARSSVPSAASAARRDSALPGPARIAGPPPRQHAATPGQAPESPDDTAARPKSEPIPPPNPPRLFRGVKAPDELLRRSRETASSSAPNPPPAHAARVRDVEVAPPRYPAPNSAGSSPA